MIFLIAISFNTCIMNSIRGNKALLKQRVFMDKFFLSVCFLVVSSLVYSMVAMFEANSNASTFKTGVEIMLKVDNNRGPAIGSNLEGK